ncbi:MAG: prolyl aminopeptidase [Myxococcota bacterium]
MQESVFYPPIQPYHTGMLAVSPLHRIYYEQCGNPNGLPVVFVHGGPGAGCDEVHRQFFDPNVYRIVLFDQRGAGRSLPFAELEDNHTGALVEDMEKLRETLGIKKWVVFGGSWGSTLALAYAETCPERVLAMVLRGIFLCRASEIHWFYQSGADQIFPDYWEDYIGFIPEAERHDMVSAYYKRLTGSDEAVRLEAARRWSIWEACASKLFISQELLSRYAGDKFALAFARIECHYFKHDSFLEPEQLIKNVHRIRHIPAVIVQGRYDIVCPMRSAWDLHRAWPEAALHIVPDAGHSAMESGISKLLMAATNRFRALAAEA